MGIQHGDGELSFTGERVVPGKTPPLIVLEHLVRYRFATRIATGRKVLDVGCGTGYGASILAAKARLVVGVDNAPEAIQYAQENYPRRNLHYAMGDCRNLPFRDRLFDLAVMFEVIEHVAEQNQCLSEIQRVLAPDGMLILSTPNATGPTKVIEDVNPFHLKELTESELLELLRPHFAHVRVLLQHELSASSIQTPAEERAGPVELTEDFSDPSAAKYFIAVCGARPPQVKAGRSLGVGGIEHQIEYLKDFRRSQKEIRVLVQQLQENEREYAKNLAAHQREIEAKQGAIDALLHQREENEREYAKALAAHQREIEAKQGAIDALLRQREEMERDYARNLAIREEALRDREQRIAALNRQLGELEIQNAARKIELEWLYRWIPVNKLARKFLYGKHLRGRLMARLHSLGKPRPPNRSFSSLDRESETQDELEQRPLEFETPTDPKVSIIIPVYDGYLLTYRCLKSLLSHTAEVSYEVAVVDDGSQDSTQQVLSRTHGLRLIRNEANRGFICSCNRGAEEARGKYLLFLNNDTLVTPHWLKELLKTFESEPKVGAVGAKLVYPDGRLQEAGSILWRDGSALGYGRGDDPLKPEYSYLREVDFCSAACLLVRKDIFQDLGGFDTRYVPAYYEDADLCMGIREKGYRVLFQPKAVIHHHEYASSLTVRSKSLMEQNQVEFAEKWRERLQGHFEYSLSNILRARDRAAGASILVVDDRVPTPDKGTGYPRAYALVKFLAELEYKVTLFPAFDPAAYQPALDDLQQLGVEVLCETDDFAGFCAKRAGLFDAVLVSRPHNLQMTYFSIKEFFPNVGLIYDAEALFFRREELKAKVKGIVVSPKDAERAARAELNLLNLADAIICVSELEKSFICQKSGVNTPKVFVWGHPLSPQPTPRPYRERKDILFVGAFPVPESPNEDAVVYFIEEIFPEIAKELDCSFCIVGAQPPDSVRRHESSRVKVLGYIKDLSEYYDAFKIFVVPHRYSAGIPLKLSEAMSRGIPAVVSSLTATQLALTDGKEVLVGSTPGEFASKVLRLYRDEGLWNEIRENALTFVRETHDPADLKNRLDDVIRSVLQMPIAGRKL